MFLQYSNRRGDSAGGDSGYNGQQYDDADDETDDDYDGECS